MDGYNSVIRNTFDMGSIRDAQLLFETCIANAFPTFHFRKLELIRFDRDTEYLEGRSWNHVFEIQKIEVKGSLVWEVNCRRVTMGKSPDKQVYLDYDSLEFAGYSEKSGT